MVNTPERATPNQTRAKGKRGFFTMIQLPERMPENPEPQGQAVVSVAQEKKTEAALSPSPPPIPKVGLSLWQRLGPFAPRVVIAFLLGLAFGTIAANRYHVQVAGQGVILVKHDRLTGKTWTCVINNQEWQEVR